jgi:hypothetical protein
MGVVARRGDVANLCERLFQQAAEALRARGALRGVEHRRERLVIVPVRQFVELPHPFKKLCLVHGILRRQ